MKVHINYGYFGLQIVFTKDEGGKRYIAKPIKLEFEEIEEMVPYGDPTMKFPPSIGEEFLKAFAEALDQRGIKTENDFKIQGLLEAKEDHLQDMRKLVFKRQERK